MVWPRMLGHRLLKTTFVEGFTGTVLSKVLVIKGSDSFISAYFRVGVGGERSHFRAAAAVGHFVIEVPLYDF